MAGVLFIVSGPSGVGKGTLVKMLVKEDPAIALSISCTTRAPRAGEVEGREYFFITKEEFQKRLHEGDFLEADEHFGNCYGTPKSFVKEQLKDKSVILEIDVVGAFQVKKNCGADFPRTVLVMVVPPSLTELEARLSGRKSETEEERKGRLERVNYELSQRDAYDYVIVNDNLSEAYAELKDIVYKEIKQSERR